jgi:hypothetical protein
MGENMSQEIVLIKKIKSKLSPQRAVLPMRNEHNLNIKK